MRDFASQFAPLQPSNLQYCTGPSSPASPKSPFGLRPRPLFSRVDDAKPSTDLPLNDARQAIWQAMKPGPWNWKCHVCRSHYPIGATRRCLQDGHYMCPGVPEWSAKKGEYRYKNGCASDFDYRGWYIYASRREALNSERGIEQRGCSSNCFHPSECRWNSEQLAIRAKKYDECKKAAHNGDKLSQAISHPEGVPGMPLKRRSVDALGRESESEGQVQTTSGTEPQAPDSRIPSLEPTVTFTVRAKATSEADRNPSAERRTERKTNRQRNIIPPLSPIKEEILSPRSQKVEEPVRRPILRFTNNLESFLNSTEKDSKCSNGVSKEDEASLEALGMVDEVDIPHIPFTRTRTENRISRPVLTFTTHFVDFLESQSLHSFLPEIEPLDDLPDFDKMDLDDPVSPDQHTGLLSSSFNRSNYSLPIRANDSPETAHSSNVDDLLTERHNGNEDSAFPSTRNSGDETLGSIGVALGNPLEDMDIEYNAW